MFGVIFDMDGVIINNNEWHVQSWMAFAKLLGIPLTEEEFPTRVFGKTNEQILSVSFPDASPEQLTRWALEKEAMYRELYRPHFQLASGLMDFLVGLKAIETPIAVASNAPLVNVDFALDVGEIRPFFDAILYAGMVTTPKPAPDIYIESARQLGLFPEQCYVIEDSPVGLAAAVAAGCRPIAITSTFPREELLQYTDFVIDSFHDPALRVENLLAGMA